MLYNLFENRDFVSVFAIALLAEGVDRNDATDGSREGYWIALLAEGVDRNLTTATEADRAHGRPPRGGRG